MRDEFLIFSPKQPCQRTAIKHHENARIVLSLQHRCQKKDWKKSTRIISPKKSWL